MPSSIQPNHLTNPPRLKPPLTPTLSRRRKPSDVTTRTHAAFQAAASNRPAPPSLDKVKATLTLPGALGILVCYLVMAYTLAYFMEKNKH